VCLLHHVHINWRFYDAKQTGIALVRAASLTDVCFGEGVAALAMTKGREGQLQGIGQVLCPRPIALH
jgi:hypothetical protein